MEDNATRITKKVESMNMSYQDKIAALKETVKTINKNLESPDITDADKSKALDMRSAYESEIRRLTKLQWEHDHETVRFDDDR